MTTLLFASIPSPSWQGFQIGPFSIHAYALCILTGIVVAVFWTDRRMFVRGVPRGTIIDIAIWAVPFGIVGARIYHVLTHPADYFGPGINPWTSLAIWEGGIAIFGALLGGALGAWIGCRRAGIRFGVFADALVPGLMAAQALGRFGNYFNHELFGKPTSLPWGLQIEATNPAYPVGLPAGTLFHPTFLYEILWNVIGIVLLLAIQRRWNPQWGRPFSLYLIWYGIGRFWLEALRIDPIDVVLGLRLNQAAAVLVVILGVVLFIRIGRRHPGLEPGPFLPGHTPEVESDSRPTTGAPHEPGNDDSARGDITDAPQVPRTSSSPRR